MLTRSKSVQHVKTDGDVQTNRDQTMHASSSRTSVASTASTIRRQRLIEVKQKTAEKLAELERRKIEAQILVEENLIRQQASIELEALENEDVSNEPPRTPTFIPNTNYRQPRCDSPAQHTPKQAETTKTSQIDKLLARQSGSKDLPIFFGAPEEWFLFYSQFKRTTELCGFTDDENIARLAKCLKGEALESVYAMLMSATSLHRIVSTLKMRFGRADTIIEMLITKIRSFHNIHHNDMYRLMKYAIDIQNAVAVMIGTEQTDHLRNSTLVKEVLSKLPSTLKYQWCMEKMRRGIASASMEDISEWLLEVAKSTAEFSNPSHSTVERKSFVPHKNERRQPVLTTSMKTDKRNCHKCKGIHDLKDCPDFLCMNIDDRWRYVTEQRLCFSCLLSRHQLKTCRTKVKCGQAGCEFIHNKVLHAAPKQSASTNNTTLATTADYMNGDAVIATTQPTTRLNHVLLKVVRVVVSGANGDFETSALLDEGASVSLVDASFAARAGICGPTQSLRMCGAHGMSSVDSTSQCVSFKIRGRSCDVLYNLCNVRTVNNLRLPVNSYHKKIVNNCYLTEYFNDDDFDFGNIDILIGQDNIDLIITRQIIKTQKGGLFISLTNLGYVLHGMTKTFFDSNATTLHLCSCEELNELFKRSFRTEDFGVTPKVESPRSREDERAIDILQTTTQYRSDMKRWETGLLWRQDDCSMPDSYDQARVRLQGIKRKMKKLPEFARKYEEKITTYVEKGYACKLTPHEAAVKSSRTWYLPHFAVFNINKPNKLRFVLDAAAKSDGKSLNHFLLPGPDFLNSLHGMLLQFRCHRYAVMGDIQEMFHQVLIIEEDRPAQRFLWEDDEYQMNVMIFGAVCSPSSAQYVKNANALRFSEIHPAAVKAILHHHYMDDLIISVDSISQGKQLVEDVIKIHAAGGFNMTSFMSNSKEILHHLPADKLSTSGAKVLSDDTEITLERVLGIKWRPDNDEFVYSSIKNLVDSQDKKHPTKRQVLKVCMSVFDPLGFLLFVTIKCRIILQDIWKSKVGWDDEIVTEHFERWRLWLHQLQQASSIQIPRWLLKAETYSGPVEVHIFCDASTRAFASVAYLRSISNDDGCHHVSLILARGRVAPLKILSVPRLELQAAVLGARMSQTIKKYIDLKISRVVLWSDSRTVLSWIRSDAGRFKPFVAHRVSEIADLTDTSEWKWVPTQLNHADFATRETPTNEIVLWLNGPDFLRHGESEWPIEDSKEPEINSSDPEMKTVLITISCTNDGLPDVSRFSNYWRLVRTTSWILRLKFNLRNKKNERRNGELQAVEIRQAELSLIKDSQARTFANDIYTLQRKGIVDRGSNLFQLVPFLDINGILRAHGRVDAANTNYDVKNPIILHPSDNFTKLLINQYHKDAAHIGKEKVLSDLRQRYWIIRARAAVRAAFRACQWCQIRKATPKPPLMGQLPLCRLSPIKPFAYTGLDYFGPMTVKIGRRQEKRYGALFTCLTIRAIHIEVVSDLSTDSAIMAIRRFIARRGTPLEIWSDNATTFKGADNELTRHIKNLDSDSLKQFYSVRRIEWKFICPNSPHHGGCWERMVRSVKAALGACLKEQVTTDQILMTLLTETEHIVNSRPLTHVPLDHNDDVPLTPNHFIFGGQTDFTTQTVDGFTDSDLLRKSWRQSQRLADLVWKRWLKEYLPTLTKRGKWFGQVEPLKIDDVVIMCDDQQPRNYWPKGIVTKTYPGTDGQVRIVDVKTVSGTYKRPVTKLCRLDVR